MASTTTVTDDGLRFIGAGLAIIGAIGAGVGQGNAGAGACMAIGRNPEASGKITTTMVISAGIAESETIEKRRNKINELLDEATSKQSLANKDRKEAKVLLDDAKHQYQEILNDAKSEADKAKFIILAKAKEEASNLHQHAKSAIDNERKEAQSDIRKSIIDLAFDAANQVLEEEISQEKHDKLVKKFIDNII
ncbi:hypothetical protein FQR65_LT17010 [Abscondita terminalis]|nr:hypothetical protein FQR65_LT17010 [Abscondita terminalis]